MEIPVEISGDNGIDVSISFKSLDIDNEDVFYTDSNGLEMRKRILNKRANWRFFDRGNPSSNFYPITSAIAIKDVSKKMQMTVLTEKA
jgi:hypothetical protein